MTLQREKSWSVLKSAFWSSCLYTVLVRMEADPLVSFNFQTSFASRHLPSLAGALLLLPPSKLAKSPWYCILVSIGPNHPLYALFIRTHEDGARLQLALMEAFAATIPSLTSFKTFDDHADKWLSLGAFCLGGLVHLFPNRLAGQPFSWTSSTEHLAIQFEKTSRDLQLLLKNGGHQSAEVLIELMNAQRAVHLLSFACSSDGFKNPLLPSLLRLVRTLVPWADCEGLNLNATACVKSSEGMLTCSRCQAVKYCSVGHQKADWKKHKPLCLAPAW
ncbi:hypothetical protein BDY24DRAFT_395645 [Mrakia frigida]|uniref:zinc finger MYND domain-containing protein n=1 Tax=Mrakia frigida TaxID=29902 RepID=UPI003FCC1C60